MAVVVRVARGDVRNDRSATGGVKTQQSLFLRQGHGVGHQGAEIGAREHFLQPIGGGPGG